MAASVLDTLGEMPIAPLITSLAKGIAEAQLALDQVSMRVAVMMAGAADRDRVFIGKRSYSLLELGLTPTFYQFTETVLEIKVSVSMQLGGKAGADKFSQRVLPVDATMSSKYQYNVEGSSSVRTKLMPVPLPPMFEEQVRDVMVAENEYRDLAAGRIRWDTLVARRKREAEERARREV